MFQSERATTWRLVDPECRTLIQNINFLKSLPSELAFGSQSLLLEYLARTDEGGPRSHMWLLEPAANHADYRPSSSAEYWERRLPKWAKQAQDKPKDAWLSASVVHLVGVIGRVEPEFLSYLESTGLKTDVLKDNLVVRLEEEAENDGDPYLSYWLYQALATSDRTAGPDIIQRVDWTAKVDKQLAAATANVSDVNPVELAAAAALALLASQCKNEGSRESRHCTAAIEILTGSGDFPTRRNVVHDGRYRFLHNLPFEELLILSGVAYYRFPTVLPRILKLIDFLTPRLRKVDSYAVGVADEGSPQYPEAAPYVTGYMGVLTDSVLRPLRFSLKRRLAERLQERGLAVQARPVGPRTQILDTEEKTFQRLRGALADCIVSDAMDFARLSSTNTILLFGPPGTGKTTLVEELVRDLNELDRAEQNDSWCLFELIPSVFLVSDSFTELLGNVEDIFGALLEVERAVFFFDEAEELMRRREKDDSRIGRFFTSAMLIHLNRLKKTRSISIFATNFIDMIDDAASRKGRFAIRKGVGPVAPDVVRAYVDKELHGRTPNEREIVKKCLRDRTPMEVIHLCELAQKCETVNQELINHRPVISPDNLKGHRDQVGEYDDK